MKKLYFFYLFIFNFDLINFKCIEFVDDMNVYLIIYRLEREHGEEGSRNGYGTKHTKRDDEMNDMNV